MEKARGASLALRRRSYADRSADPTGGLQECAPHVGAGQVGAVKVGICEVGPAETRMT